MPKITEGTIEQLPRRLEKPAEKKGPSMVYDFRSKDTKRNMQAKLRLKKLKANEETEMTISESVQNIIQTAIQGEPKDVKAAVDAAINEKIAQALEARKSVIANNLVGLGESEDEPGWSKPSEKASRAKKLAMDKIKKQAKDEDVEFSDEEVELILEEILSELSKKTLGSYVKKASVDVAGHAGALQIANRLNNNKAAEKHGNKTTNRIVGIHRATDKLTKEAVDHMAAWFTEEELLPILEAEVAAFGSEHKTASGTPSELSSAISRNKTSFNLGLKKKVNEAPLLGQGSSKEAQARDVDQSDKEYIEQNKFKASYKAKHGSFPGWSKVNYKRGQTNVDESEQNPTDCVKPGFGNNNTKNKSPGKPGKPSFNPKTYTTSTPLGYDTGSKQPGDIMGKTNEEENLDEARPGREQVKIGGKLVWRDKHQPGNIYKLRPTQSAEKQKEIKQYNDSRKHEEIEQFNEMSPFAPTHAHRTGKKYGQQGGPKSDNPYPKKHILYTHWNQGHDEGTKISKAKNEETIDEVTKVSRSALAKKIKHGWHKGKGNFERIAAKAERKYGSKAAGDRVAGAIMWHKYAHEDIQYTDEEIDYLITECWEAIDEKVQELKESLQDQFEIELTDDEVDLILEDILTEESPKGWQHVVKKLLQKKEGGSFSGNPWAIAWSMKNKGYHPHKENQISRKSYDKWYQGTGKKIAGYA